MRLGLIHWNAKEREEKITGLQSAGHEVLVDLTVSQRFAKQLEEAAPDALLIDLSRLPSQGRDAAVMVRTRKGTRHIPIVFLEGEPEKLAAIRDLLPDAVYTRWDDLKVVLEQVGLDGSRDYAPCDSVFAAYSGKSLAQKLGLKDGIKLCVSRPPGGFRQELGPLPPRADYSESVEADAGLYLWFEHDSAELIADLPAIVKLSQHAPCWIAWPKKGVGIATDLSQQTVREKSMAEGLVDYKICSINDHWSALLFAWRR